MADPQGTSPERPLVSWLEDYMSVSTSGCITEPDIAMLYKLLHQTDPETIFRILYTVRGEIIELLYIAPYADVIRSLLCSLRPAHQIKLLWTAPSMRKYVVDQNILYVMMPLCVGMRYMYQCVSTFRWQTLLKLIITLIYVTDCCLEWSICTSYYDEEFVYDDDPYWYSYVCLQEFFPYLPYDVCFLSQSMMPWGLIDLHGLIGILVVGLVTRCSRRWPRIRISAFILLVCNIIRLLKQLMQMFLFTTFKLVQQAVALDCELTASSRDALWRISHEASGSDRSSDLLAIRIVSISQAPIFTVIRGGLRPINTAAVLQTILEVVDNRYHDALFKAYFCLPGRIGITQRALKGHYEYHKMLAEEKSVQVWPTGRFSLLICS